MEIYSYRLPAPRLSVIFLFHLLSSSMFFLIQYNANIIKTEAIFVNLTECQKTLKIQENFRYFSKNTLLLCSDYLFLLPYIKLQAGSVNNFFHNELCYLIINLRRCGFLSSPIVAFHYHIHLRNSSCTHNLVILPPFIHFSTAKILLPES